MMEETAFFAILLLISLVQNPSGVMTKTIEVCIHKEGNSFGFVVRGMYKCEQTTSKNSPFLVQFFFNPFDFRRLP